MSMGDLIVDFLTHIRNASVAQHESVETPASKVKRDITEILRNEGSIRDVEYVDNNKQGIIRVLLKYGNNGQRVISGLRRIFKPGLRAYVKLDAVLKVLNGLGTTIISISEGVVTDRVARAKKIGSEVITYVW